MPNIEEIITRDRSSGRYHKRYVVDGRIMVDERCNLDQAGAYDVVTRGGPDDRGDGVPRSADEKLLCKWCFTDSGSEWPTP